MPLSEGTSTKPGRVAHHQHPVAAAALGQRVVAALGNRLGAPLEQLAALEMGPEERVQLHPLQQLVHVERGVVVVEPDHEAERDLRSGPADT